MSYRTQPLVVGRVIQDVIDMFAPSSLEMLISYSTCKVSNGCNINPFATTKCLLCACQIPTCVMVDSDVPSPSEPTMQEWVHQSVQEREIVPYMASKLTMRIHMYVFVLFCQRGPMVVVHAPTMRHNFCTRLFATKHDLGLPEATLYFNAQKEPTHSYCTHKRQPNKDSKDLLKRMRFGRVHSSVLTLPTA
ncbi:hypothetical protein L7F22_022713 [Adiantum nelumboides]|nr:hypothetical protein [Adiantum nelumboides]